VKRPQLQRNAGWIARAASRNSKKEFPIAGGTNAACPVADYD
jgi:hypothetical protein